MMGFFMTKLIFVVVFVLMQNGLIFGQVKEIEQPRVVTEKSSCDITELELSLVFSNFEKKSLEGSFLIIIGKRALEEKEKYNSARILNIVKTFKRFGLGEHKIIYAAAKPEDKFAHVEILINGRIALNMRTLSKMNFCTFCCDDPVN